MQQVNFVEASKHLPDLIEAAISGEEIVITKDDQPVVKLTPLLPINRHPQFGSAKELLVTIPDDFDEPIVDAAYSSEEVMVTKEDQTVVKLITTSPSNCRPKFGSAKGLVTISDDFDEPLEDFKDYM